MLKIRYRKGDQILDNPGEHFRGGDSAIEAMNESFEEYISEFENIDGTIYINIIPTMEEQLKKFKVIKNITLEDFSNPEDRLKVLNAMRVNGRSIVDDSK